MGCIGAPRGIEKSRSLLLLTVPCPLSSLSSAPRQSHGPSDSGLRVDHPVPVEGVVARRALVIGSLGQDTAHLGGRQPGIDTPQQGSHTCDVRRCRRGAVEVNLAEPDDTVALPGPGSNHLRRSHHRQASAVRG